MRQESITRPALKSPRAAAIAGILFGLLYSASLVLIRISIPSELTIDNAAWLETNSRFVILALNLVPYSGIAFLWFIGVIRDHIGDREDRLFSTVFLGSGLLFLALTFVGAALSGGLLSSFVIDPARVVEGGVFLYSRSVVFQVINIYAIRMAGVFMISLGTIWMRTGLMHRAWTILTYMVALILLLSIGLSLWVTLIFPIWVLIVSLNILVRNLRNTSQEEVNTQINQ